MIAAILGHDRLDVAGGGSPHRRFEYEHELRFAEHAGHLAAFDERVLAGAENLRHDQVGDGGADQLRGALERQDGDLGDVGAPGGDVDIGIRVHVGEIGVETRRGAARGQQRYGDQRGDESDDGTPLEAAPLNLLHLHSDCVLHLFLPLDIPQLSPAERPWTACKSPLTNKSIPSRSRAVKSMWGFDVRVIAGWKRRSG